MEVSISRLFAEIEYTKGVFVRPVFVPFVWKRVSLEFSKRCQTKGSRPADVKGEGRAGCIFQEDERCVCVCIYIQHIHDTVISIFDHQGNHISLWYQ